MSRYWYKLDDGLEDSEGRLKNDNGLLRFLKGHFSKADIRIVTAKIDGQGWYHYDTHDIVLRIDRIKETDGIPTLTQSIERSG